MADGSGVTTNCGMKMAIRATIAKSYLVLF
jgi:hypothetical protein